MLNADQVTQPSNSSAGATEISELPLAVECGRVPDDVIMNMLLIGVSADDESVFAFQKS